MNQLNVLIVDDERLARKRLRNLLKLCPGVNVSAECANGREALDALAASKPDVMFLDIQMPELDGFAMLGQLNGHKLPLIVFVTAYDQYAVRAFEVNAVDYLLKPFDRERFDKTMERVRERLQAGAVQPPDRLESLLESLRPRKEARIAVRSGGSVLMVKTTEIDWVEAADNYICLHCGGTTHILRETMSSFGSLLDPATFVRIHRSAIVNLDRIQQLQPMFRGDYRVVLRDGTQLTLSRNYRERLQELLLRWD
ncbi:MAG: response regulator transcription factor [Acidobacteria bacterium]|nr:response regulator transcription factor [Acidobacteriota bacterium]